MTHDTRAAAIDGVFHGDVRHVPRDRPGLTRSQSTLATVPPVRRTSSS